MQWFLLAGLIEAILLRLRSLGDLRNSLLETLYLQIVLGILYLFAVCAANGTGRRRAAGILLAALVFRLTVWPIAPALSEDVYRYRWEGAVQAAGGNPYFARPADPEWVQLRDSTYPFIPGVDFHAVYGPLAEHVSRATWALVDGRIPDPVRQAFWFKAPAAIADLLALAAALLLLRAYSMPLERVVIYAWCPLPIIEFWGNGHNDALAVAALLAALALARRQHHAWALAAVGVAAAVKVWPLALVPLFCRHSRWRHAWIAPAVFAAIALPYWPPDYREIIQNARFASGFVGGWRNNDSLFGAFLWLAGGDFYIAKRLAFGTAGAVLAALVLLGARLERAVLIFTAALLAVSANCHAWYLTWMLPALVIEPWLPVLLWIVLSPLSYAPLFLWHSTREWVGIQTTRWFIYVPVSFVILVSVIVKGCSPKQRLLMKPR